VQGVSSEGGGEKGVPTLFGKSITNKKVKTDAGTREDHEQKKLKKRKRITSKMDEKRGGGEGTAACRK